MKGVAYWLGDTAASELEGGALVAAPPHVNGVVRASQLNEVALRHFCFNPQSVVGLFSLAERAQIARPQPGAALIFPARHPAAQVLAQAPLPGSVQTRLAGRASLLHAALLVMAEAAAPDDEAGPGGGSARRFQRLAAAAPDSALLRYSAQELASLCGCTPRHLNVLWHRQLGCNIRSVQRELRLHLARERIAHGREKIADIAHSVGFTNVSRFNAAFKKMFGCTPTECRMSVAKS